MFSRSLRCLAILFVVLPLMVQAQTTPPVAGAKTQAIEQQYANHLLHQAPAQVAEIAPGVVLPLWRSQDGRLLAIIASVKPVTGIALNTPLRVAGHAFRLRAVDASPLLTETLRYQFGNGLHADARVSQRVWKLVPGCSVAQGPFSSCLGSGGSVAAITGAELGAGFSHRGLGFELALGLSRPSGLRGPGRVVPDLLAGNWGQLPLGLAGDSTKLRAQGQIALGQTLLGLGAGYGQITTNPLLLPGISSFSEKSLQLSLNRGAFSGVITGRVLVPDGPSLVPGRQSGWTTLDLGITWRLPWHGALSIGAQNLWSQGKPLPGTANANGTARIPYVQYKQDL